MTPAETTPVQLLDAAVSGIRDGRDAANRPEERQESSANQPSPDSEAALLAFAYVEYQRLCLRGQPPDVQEWCAQFPFPSSCRSVLQKSLEMEIKLAPFLERFASAPGSWDESIDWPQEGEERAGFTILRELGRGGFARVYLATEASTGDRLVVLKCSLLGDAEARTMGRLSHPGIVSIFSARREERSGLCFVCMPYLGSATLEDVLDRVRKTADSPPRRAAFLLDVIRSRAQPEDPPPPLADARLQQGSYADGIIHLAVQLAETLAFLHQRGVRHCDLKPSNVLLDQSGKPLLLDFNLSDSEREAAVPVGGTLRYMAPEQLRAYLDQRKDGMDGRADLYALGVMVYELLAGDHPCGRLPANSAGPRLAESLQERLNARFRSFRNICPELERPVARVLDRCLAVENTDRPRSAADLATELRRQFTPARRLHRWLAARRRGVIAVLSVLVVSVAILAYTWALTPPYSQREYDLGRTAYHAGDYDAAERHFDRAVRAELNDERFRFARGCARLQQSKYLPTNPAKFDLILEDLTVLEDGPTDPRTLAVHAYVRLRKQECSEAIKMYNQLYNSGYRPVMVLNNRGYGYMSTSQWEDAQRDLENAVQLDPHSQAVRYNRALIALRMRVQRKTLSLPSHALEDIEQALQLGPTTAALSRDAAIFYAQAAQDEPDPAHFEHALSHLHQAIAAGVSPAQFTLSSSLTEALKRPEFAALINSHPPQRSSHPELRLIDPVDLWE
jgi:serine/threonine protein kinase